MERKRAHCLTQSIQYGELINKFADRKSAFGQWLRVPAIRTIGFVQNLTLTFTKPERMPRERLAFTIEFNVVIYRLYGKAPKPRRLP